MSLFFGLLLLSTEVVADQYAVGIPTACFLSSCATSWSFVLSTVLAFYLTSLGLLYSSLLRLSTLLSLCSIRPPSHCSLPLSLCGVWSCLFSSETCINILICRTTSWNFVLSSVHPSVTQIYTLLLYSSVLLLLVSTAMPFSFFLRMSLVLLLLCGVSIAVVFWMLFLPAFCSVVYPQKTEQTNERKKPAIKHTTYKLRIDTPNSKLLENQ